MPRRSQKVLVLRTLQSAAFRRYFAAYYVGYALIAFVGGLVLAVVTFLLFLFLCDYVGVTDPAGNSGALLVLAAFEIGVLSVYGALVLRKVKARINKAVYHLPSYRRDPTARR
jgi:predicted lysophospholipase L1 biosynthesis ABC-type transport system permease subunit